MVGRKSRPCARLLLFQLYIWSIYNVAIRVHGEIKTNSTTLFRKFAEKRKTYARLATGPQYNVSPGVSGRLRVSEHTFVGAPRVDRFFQLSPFIISNA